MDLSIVIKVSKLCNLRCAYCYETPWLADAARMSIEDIASIFSAVKELLLNAPRTARRVSFYWQGGEPFAHHIEYWRNLIEVQREIFRGSCVDVCNEIQSNGTLITSEHLSLLRRDYLLGLSFDVANDLRVTGAGRATADKVVTTLDWLLAENVKLSGCIAVVSRNNIDRPYEIADFFLSRSLDFRLLNVYAALDALQQVREQAVNWLEYLRFCETLLFYEPVRRALDAGLSIEPFGTALSMLRTHKGRAARSKPNDGEREWVWVVDTNGDVYSAGDLYDPDFRYGNAFRDSIDSLLMSTGRQRRIERGRSRIEAICERCFLYRKGCDGTYVAHCTPEEAREFEKIGTCYYGWLAASADQMEMIPVGAQ
jgi:uncharacterized protein